MLFQSTWSYSGRDQGEGLWWPFHPDHTWMLWVHTWNPNDPCFEWKGPCFGGLTCKNRGHLGFRYINIFLIQHVCGSFFGHWCWSTLGWRVEGMIHWLQPGTCPVKRWKPWEFCGIPSFGSEGPATSHSMELQSRAFPRLGLFSSNQSWQNLTLPESSSKNTWPDKLMLGKWSKNILLGQVWFVFQGADLLAVCFRKCNLVKLDFLGFTSIHSNLARAQERVSLKLVDKDRFWS